MVHPLYARNVHERIEDTLRLVKHELMTQVDPVIYDIGGYGQLTKLIRDRYGHARAQDLAHPDLNTKPISLPDGGADFVFLLEVLEHLWNPDRVLRECHRILKPGGIFVLSTPNLVSWFNRLLVLAGYLPQNLDISCELRYSGRRDIFPKVPVTRYRFDPQRDVHIRLYNLPSLEILLDESGFVVLERSGYVVSDSFNFKLGGAIRLVNGLFGRVPSLAQGLILKCRSRPLS